MITEMTPQLELPSLVLIALMGKPETLEVLNPMNALLKKFNLLAQDPKMSH
jgi:hypothetical protein